MRRPRIDRFTRLPLVLAMLALIWLAGSWWWEPEPPPFTADERAVIASLSLASLPPLPPDPSNAVADDPRAAEFGQQLFFDTRLSSTNTVSCAACHRPDMNFSDGLQRARALGRSPRNTPSIRGTAYSPWLYWDGRKDSQWAQALAPLEDPNEQGSNRMALVRLLAGDKAYRHQYEALFGPLPDVADHARFPDNAAPAAGADLNRAWWRMTETDREGVNRAFANLGKAIAAYERTLLPEPARFDEYAAALAADDQAAASALMTRAERKGLRLFIGPGRCVECHNGPLFTNNEFHNTGLLPLPGEVPDQGRSRVLDQLRADPFNCLGPYSDAAPAQCRELRFMRDGPALIGAMRTPSLRNLAGTAPYMHKGQFDTLAAVLDHYNEAPLALIGHNEAEPLGLSGRQLDQLEAFLLTLQASR